MIVLRLENRHSKGPVNHDRKDPEAEEARNLMYAANIPSPISARQEPYLSARWLSLSMPVQQSYFFGFASRCQYRRYFSPAVSVRFRELGWRIYFYEVDPKHVVCGNSQLMFVKQFARRIR